MRKKFIYPIVASLVFLVGCKPDGSDLNKAIAFYYEPGKPPLNPRKYYHLLSSRSKAEVSIEKWSESFDPKSFGFEKAEVLRQASQAGNTYALVSVTRVPINGLKDVLTATWMQEDGKWRRLNFPKTQEEATRSFDNGDYTASYAKAQEWLKADPFSVEAYKILAYSMIRGGANKAGGGQSMDDIIRSILSINQNDSTINFIATTFTTNVQIAKTFLKHLEGTHFYASAASNLCLKMKPLDRLRFFDEIKMDTGLKIKKVFTLVQLGPDYYEACRALLAEPDFEKAAAETLAGSDASYAANNSAFIGLAELAVGNGSKAQQWLDLAASKDPNAPVLKLLSEAVAAPDPKTAAEAGIRIAIR